jgi:hypothetical protein
MRHKVQNQKSKIEGLLLNYSRLLITGFENLVTYETFCACCHALSAKKTNNLLCHVVVVKHETVISRQCH